MRCGNAGEVPEAAGPHEDLSSGCRMTPHRPELLVCEYCRFVQDQIGYAEFSDVMQQRRAADLTNLFVRIAHHAGDCDAGRRDTA
jgi:hypothetical protein